VAAALFLAGLAAGLRAPPQLVEQVVGLLREFVGRVMAPNPIELMARILLNNLRVVAIAALTSPLVVAPLLIALANGVVLGITLAYASGRLPWALAVLAVAPHGVVEIPALLYSVAACTDFGLALWRRLRRRGGEPWLRPLARLARSLAIAALLFAAAAFIEAFVTPLLLAFGGGAPPL